jgi:hypothetical protein
VLESPIKNPLRKEKIMKLRTLFVLHAIVSVLLAVGFLLGPATLLKFFGFTTGKTEVLLVQVAGAALIGFAALAWFGKDFADPQSVRGTVASLLIFSAIGFVVVLLGLLSQVTRAGSAWLIAVVFLLAAAGYGYFEFAGPRE